MRMALCCSEHKPAGVGCRGELACRWCSRFALDCWKNVASSLLDWCIRSAIWATEPLSLPAPCKESLSLSHSLRASRFHRY